jgi:hypothetical protein
MVLLAISLEREQQRAIYLLRQSGQGQIIFVQIANAQFFGSYTRNRKSANFLGSASPQIANLQVCLD